MFWHLWTDRSTVLKRVGTGAEVNDEVSEKERVGDTIEDNPVRAEIIVEERYGDWKHNQIRQQKNQHKHVPVKPE